MTKKTIEKIIEGKKVFVDRFHIHWATDHTINKRNQFWIRLQVYP